RTDDEPAPARLAREVALRHEPVDQPVGRCFRQFQRGDDVENVDRRGRAGHVLENGEGARRNAEFPAPDAPGRRLERTHAARRGCCALVKSKIGTHGSPMGHLTSVWAVTNRLLMRRCANGSNRTMMVIATIVPEIGRVKKMVQSLEKLIMVFMNASSAIGPRMTPSTSGATGNFSRSKP